MGSSTVHVEYDALASVRAQLAEVAEVLRELRQPVASGVDDLSAGAGELVAALSGGASAFGLSWAAVLGVSADSAGLVAGNIGVLAVDLQATDAGAGAVPHL